MSKQTSTPACRSQTPPLLLHLHQYAAETAAVMAMIRMNCAYNAGKHAGEAATLNAIGDLVGVPRFTNVERILRDGANV